MRHKRTDKVRTPNTLLVQVANIANRGRLLNMFKGGDKDFLNHYGFNRTPYPELEYSDSILIKADSVYRWWQNEGEFDWDYKEFVVAPLDRLVWLEYKDLFGVSWGTSIVVCAKDGQPWPQEQVERLKQNLLMSGFKDDESMAHFTRALSVGGWKWICRAEIFQGLSEHHMALTGTEKEREAAMKRPKDLIVPGTERKIAEAHFTVNEDGVPCEIIFAANPVIRRGTEHLEEPVEKLLFDEIQNRGADNPGKLFLKVPFLALTLAHFPKLKVEGPYRVPALPGGGERTRNISEVSARIIDLNPLDEVMVGAGWPGRNESCVCGSGKKFKKCCQGKIIGTVYTKGHFAIYGRFCDKAKAGCGKSLAGVSEEASTCPFCDKALSQTLSSNGLHFGQREGKIYFPPSWKVNGGGTYAVKPEYEIKVD